MSHSIEIDTDVWDLLKREAEPLVDTPNTVLRRLLTIGVEEPTSQGKSETASSVRATRRSAPKGSTTGKRARKRGPRAPVGSLLPEAEYEGPILRVLGEHGGSAPARDVVKHVGKLVDDRLMPLDRESQPNGLKRWETRVQFTRLRMRKDGLIAAASPRGIWELSKKGLAAYEELGASA
jgi:Mrr restriction endonuclease-like protein